LKDVDPMLPEGRRFSSMFQRRSSLRDWPSLCFTVLATMRNSSITFQVAWARKSISKCWRKSLLFRRGRHAREMAVGEVRSMNACLRAGKTGVLFLITGYLYLWHQSPRKKLRISCFSFSVRALKLLITTLASEGGNCAFPRLAWA